MDTHIAFLDHDVEIRSAARHDATVAVYVRDSAGNVIGLHLHEGDVEVCELFDVDIRLIDAHGEELRPFIKRTALIERKVAAR